MDQSISSTTSEIYLSSIPDAEYFSALDTNDLSSLHERSYLEYTPCFTCCTTFHNTLLNRHPLLAVPVCNPCKQFYTSQPWKRDSDDSYFDRCRSCAKDNHKLIQCRRPDCYNVFCNFCLEKNVGFIRNMPSWSCLTCDNSQILPARSKYFSIFNYWREKHDHSRSSDAITRFFSLSKEAQSEYKDSILWEYEMWRKVLVRETKPSFSQQKEMGLKLLDIYEKAADKYSKIVMDLRMELKLSKEKGKEEVQESQIAPDQNSSAVIGSSNDDDENITETSDEALPHQSFTTKINKSPTDNDSKTTESSRRSSSSKISNANSRNQQQKATSELFGSESKVAVETLNPSILRKLDKQGFIEISDFTKMTQKTRHSISSESAAIARLCNLNNLIGSGSSKKSSSFTAKKTPSMKKKLEESLFEKEIEEIDLEDSDDSEEEIIRSSSFAPALKNTFDSSSSSSSSSSDMSGLSDEDEPKEAGKKIKNKIQKERESSSPSDSKKTKSQPDFMTMSLDPKLDNDNSTKSSNKKRKRVLLARNSSENTSSRSTSPRSSVSTSEDDSDNVDNESKDNSAKYKRKKRMKLPDKDSESPNKGRKNIHKIIKTSQLSETTKEAAELERDRRKRIQEKKDLYLKEFSSSLKSTEKLQQLVLDFDQETKTPFLEVHSELVQHLKPHQADGVRFMWDSVFESSNDVKKSYIPGGAILAHCMGLGKTLQTITLIHTVLTNFSEYISRVLIICPVNTIKNWKDEFDKWCKGSQSIDVHEISEEKDNQNRVYRLKTWVREGGVLIIGYGMFRNLTVSNKKLKSNHKEVFMSSLVDPGPDIVICDEGHILKNRKSALNIALNQIKTRRRIILTGTPLQNNLSEYFAMVDFVKPKLLGTYAEFKNRFANPIQNGQHSDSTDRDVRIMKKRSFILSDLLKGCLQRLDYGVLVPYLQPKYEYVLSINLTSLQKRLYKYYLENFAKAGHVGGEGKMEDGKKGGLFNDVTTLSQIWNHPVVLLLSKERNDLKNMIDDGEEELMDNESNNASSDTTDVDSSVDSDVEVLEVRNSETLLLRSFKNENGGTLLEGIDDGTTKTGEWWSKLIEGDEELENIYHSSKIVILLEILKNAEILGDKTLVFSQSLLSLDMIEIFLETLDKYYAKKDMEDVPEPLKPFVGPWKSGKNYFRMDGSTSAGTRKLWCNYFNDTSNTSMKLFLISTKAGGLGINLVAANRVVIFDASWNPAHDLQSIFRVYRFGQDKPVYIYRFLAKGTMEEKIYDRQVTKQSLSARVVDEQQIERHFSVNELAELYEYNDQDESERPIPNVPTDNVLAEILRNHPDKIWKYHDHDSLLENQEDENLTEEERKAAWEEYENEKKGRVMTNVNLLPGAQPAFSNRVLVNEIDFLKIQSAYRRQNPNISNEDLLRLTRQYILQLKNVTENQNVLDYHVPDEFLRSPAKSSQQHQMAANSPVANQSNKIASSPNFLPLVNPQTPQTPYNLQPLAEVFIEEGTSQASSSQ